MNYATAFLGLIFVFATVYWIISGRKFYTGPLVEADIADEENSPDRRDASSGEQSRGGGKDGHAVLDKKEVDME